jgi:hypothetical protein
MEPKVCSCLEIAEWKGGNSTLEDLLIKEADAITATGSDETIEAVHKRVPFTKRFLAYGHRVSFGYVSRKALSSSRALDLIKAAAQDVVAWDQLGCLSPQVFYVEHGGRIAPEMFAQLLAEELEELALQIPRGHVSPETAAAISYRRSFYEIRSTKVEQIRIWQSQNSTAWTVVFDPDPLFSPTPLHRFVHVKGVGGLEEALQGADPVIKHVSTIGLGATEDERRDLAQRLAFWGAPRVCLLGKMQDPPLLWRHDGRPAIADLLTWTDLESA